MLFLVLAGVVLASVNADNTYLIISPALITPGQPFTVSIQILNASDPVNVDVTVLRSWNNNSQTIKEPLVSASKQCHQGEPGGVSLTVPRHTIVGSLLLKVEGQGGLIFERESSLRIRRKTVSVFIQTDKGIYKPGQRVHVRTFAVYPDLKMHYGQMDMVIKDPHGNKIHQWIGLEDPTGVIHRDMLLSDQPVLGIWTIKITTPDKLTTEGLQQLWVEFGVGKHMHDIPGDCYFSRTTDLGMETTRIKVQQYELPKYEVKVELPPFGLVSDETLTGKVKADYTYGKGVKGMVDLRVYVGAIRNYCGQLLKSVSKAFPIDGSADFSVPLSDVKKLQSYLNYQIIHVVATVTEELTGKALNGTAKLTYYTTSHKIEFLSLSPNTFKPGLPYRAYAKVSTQDQRPVNNPSAGVQIYTCVDYERKAASQDKYECSTFTGSYDLPVLNLTIPPDGVIPLDLDIPDNTTQLRMRAYFRETFASWHISKSLSPSDTYVQIRTTSLTPKIDDTVEFKIQATTPPGTVAYQVMSRGSLQSSGTLTPSNPEDTTLTLSLHIVSTMSPSTTIFVHFVKPDGEIVADTIQFRVDGGFANKVGIEYSQERAEPHSEISVDVTADPDSVAFLLAVDQSVLLLESGNDITTDKVMSEISGYSLRRPPLGKYPHFPSARYPKGIFSWAGLMAITDALLYDEDAMYRGRSNSGGAGFGQGVAFGGRRSGPAPIVADYDDSISLVEVERVREIFPETWLWVNTSIGEDGRSRIQTTVPDTITSWIASAFAINSNSGLGVASETSKLEVFRNFFVSLNLPQSVVKGEQVVIQANVFNYFPTEEQVTVELKSDSGFQSVLIGEGGAETLTDATQTRTVDAPPGEGTSVYFPIVPTVIGSVTIEVSARTVSVADAVKRPLTVKAEGVRKEVNMPVVIDLTSKRQLSQTLSVQSPPGLVEGSERTHLSVTGDILGPSIGNIDNLLALPTGCGEQNLLKFAPNIYVADYMTATKQMSPYHEDKIKTYLEIGYQRQLSYQRRDKSFSTFGERDEAGSVWLTAFVVKSFYQARRYIFVDSYTIDSALDWLLEKQTKDGAFVEPGRVFDKQLQGSSPRLTAYVVVALLETRGHNGSLVNSTRLETAIDKAVGYLDALPFNKLEPYPLALTAYALSKAESTNSYSAFTAIKKHAKKTGGKKYWDVKVEKDKKNDRVESIDILTTSYALMTFVAKGKYSPGVSIMKWLAAQRNPNGGFKSSQDTTVALEALSQFMVGVQPDEYNIEIEVTGGGETRTVTVNSDNSLVLQSIDLPSVPGELKISARGVGMAVVELGLFYNVKSVGDDSDVFDISTVLLDDTINGFTLMTCTKHLEEGSSGMCVQTIQIPSGFTADLSSTGNVVGLKRLEQKSEGVVAYFDQVGKSSTCITLSCSRTGMVAKNQPVYISLVDYYKPGDGAVVSYNPRTLKATSTCEICPQCLGCV